jgi:hypothetical protein
MSDKEDTEAICNKVSHQINIPSKDEVTWRKESEARVIWKRDGEMAGDQQAFLPVEVIE